MVGEEKPYFLKMQDKWRKIHDKFLAQFDTKLTIPQTLVIIECLNDLDKRIAKLEEKKK